MTRVDDEDVREFNEGLELMKANNLTAAIEKFRMAASKGVDRPMEHYALAVALYRNEGYAEAKNEMERFLQMSPADNQHVRKAKSILPIIEAKLTNAARPTEAKNRLSDNEPYNQALNAYLRGDYEAALEAFQKARKSFPESKHVYNNLGLTYLALKNHKMAVVCFGKALAFDPEFLDARNNLGLAWLDYGAAKAKESFESILEADADFFDALVNLASLCYRQGDMPRARQLWERAHAIRPDDPQVKRNLEIFR